MPTQVFLCKATFSNLMKEVCKFLFHKIKYTVNSYYVSLLSNQFSCCAVLITPFKMWIKNINNCYEVLSANIHGGKPAINIQSFKFSSDVKD